MRPVRWLVIIVAEIGALLFIALGSYLGSRFGAALVAAARVPTGWPLDLTAYEARIAGAVVGFVGAALVAAMFFVLVEIAANTRRIAAALERRERPYS
jgi:hypothetical protein